MNRICSLVTATAMAACLAAQQNVVLPDDHHLMENPTQLANAGATTWWRTTAGRFQVIYEASHFVGKSAVTGPMLITKLRFRGEDGEPNLGGQVYTGVTVELGETTLSSTTMSTTWATNRAAATTTMGTLGTTTVTLAPSVGSTPNNYCIEIDLLAIGAAFLYDPTGPRPNLLIDVTMPTAPSNAPPLALIPIQDTTAGTAGIRGRGLSSATPAAATGTSSATPPVIGLEFLGPGGATTLYPARNERYGAACGGAASTFYEHFQNGQAWDLTGLVLIPDNAAAPNYYIVSTGTTPVDLTKLDAVPDSVADDALITHALGFTFRFPGGSTSSVKPCTNGFVWLDSTMTSTTYTPTLADMLGTTTNLTSRLMLYWNDLHAGRNTSTTPNSGLHAITDTTGGPGNSVCYVTWHDVGLFRTPSGTGIGGHAVISMQCVLHENTGMVEFRYGTMPAFCSHWTTTALALHTAVGFTRGRIAGIASVDPQSRDLSIEAPFATAIEGTRGNIGQVVTATPDAGGVIYGGRWFGGQTLVYGASNVPPGSIIGAQLLDLTGTRPGLMLPGITAPDCMLSTSTAALVWEVFVLPTSTVTGTRPVILPHGFDGFEVYAQFLVLDGLLGGPNLITGSSNAIKHIVGRD